MSHLNNIRIVMLNTYHAGNIGSAARAMKTMGLSELALVNPRQFPHEQASSLAAGAGDLLTNVKVYDSLADAIADRTQVFATSARQEHSYARPQRNVEQAVEWITDSKSERIAIVFGGERDGLSSAEISLCQQILYIPGNPEYSVLNVASAVQIVCYELNKQFTKIAQGETKPTPSNKDSLTKRGSKATASASTEQLEHYFVMTESLLRERGYFRTSQPSDSLKRLRQLINRINPSAQELSLLTGIHKALARKPTDKID